MNTRLRTVLSVLTLLVSTLLTACGGSSGLEIQRSGTGGKSAIGAAGEAGFAENAGERAVGGSSGNSALGEGGAGNTETGGSAGLGGSTSTGGATNAAGFAGTMNTAGAFASGGMTSVAGAAGSISAGGSAGAGTAGMAGAAGAPSAALVSVAVTPAVASVAVGTQALLKATGTYSDGSTRDVTTTAIWTSDDTSVATVNDGTVTAVNPGSAGVSATLGMLVGASKITVPAAIVSSLTVTPASATTGVQGTIPFHAVATLSDGTTQDVTATATWTPSDATIASVTSAGIATGLKAGSSDIQASVDMVSGSATLTVTSATLSSIDVTPTNPGLAVGVTQTFTATGTFSDGSVADVSSNATWTSSTTAVAGIDATTHVATTLSAGTTTISANVGSVTGSTTLTVTAATLINIIVSPGTSTLALNGTVDLTATGGYSDGSSVDVTASVTWSSNTTSVASVSNAAGSQGTVTGLTGGSAMISATAGNVTGSANVTVTPASLVSIVISPSGPSLPLGTVAPFSAEGSYSDGSQVDVTKLVTWTSDTAGVASVSNATGSQGQVTAVAVGTSVVHATLGSVSAQTTVTVTAAQLTSIALSPANPSVPAGETQALSATGVYSDGTQTDLTTQATWTSGTPADATVSNASGSQGTVTAVATGSSVVTATFGAVAGSTTVTVSAPVLTQIVISPIADSVRVNGTVNYSAIGIYSNNTQAPLNRTATWTSSNPAVATLAAGGGAGFGGGIGGGGPAVVVATGIAAGNSTISVALNGVTSSTTLTVTSATLTTIEVTPTDPALSVNATRALTATAIYDDATTVDVTATATWVSSTPAVAAVSTGGGGGGGPGGGAAAARGTVTALTAGNATISATFDGITGSTVVTVSAATIVSVEVTPAAPSVAIGTQVTFTATALYSDNTSQNVTPRATWISSTPGVASVSTANGTRGVALALTAGTTTVSATVDGMTGSTTLTVTSATLTSIQITPFSPTMPVGFNTNLVATGIYSDNTTRDLTALTSWTSSAPNVAAVSDATATRGALTPVAAGTATVTASYQGVTGSDTITVSNATLMSISVTPASATISVHATQAFVATGTLSDATTLDLTNYVTWLSTTPGVASVSNAAGSRGMATGLSTGYVSISAVRGTVTGSASLTVQ